MLAFCQGAAQHFAMRKYQESDLAGPGDLLRRSTWGGGVHGAIFIRDRLRGKDKDPSFPAK
jgi:hypothetical protein